MRKLSAIKGILIGSIFSAMFWIGTYAVVSSFDNEEIPQEQIIQPKTNSTKPIA